MRSVRSGKAPADRAGTPVRVQFAAAFGTLVAVAALVIGFGILTVGGLEGQEQQISGRAVPYLTGLSDASVAAKSAANDERGYLLTADPTYSGEAQGRRKTEQSGLAQARAAAADAAQRDAVDKVSAALDTFNQALDAEFAMVATDQAGAVKMAVGPNRDLRKGYEKDFDAAIALAKKRVATVSATSHAQSRQARVLLLVLLGVMIVLGAGAAWLLGRAVTGPLVAGVAVLEAAAKGDLTRRAPVAGAREFRRMARSTNEMLSATADAIGTIAANADTLGATATQLAAASRDIAGSTDSAAEQAGQVSTAAAQVSESVQSVATAAEEMGATIGQIADSAAGAARVAAQAVDAAGAARDTVGSLDESSQRIGEVVRTITAIAEQTNLLALNATIEAARAGDAGKGFAVVASEVKDLAQETAQATEDIVERVAGIQADTRQAIDAIARIDTVIGQINEYQTSIASTVEEQSATTAEIGRSIILAATGSSSIADNITSVAAAVRDTTDQTGQAQEVATSLARMGHDLRSLVARFRY